MFDIVGTSLGYIGLGFMKDAGFFQMLRVSPIIFCALISIPVLKQVLTSAVFKRMIPFYFHARNWNGSTGQESSSYARESSSRRYPRSSRLSTQMRTRSDKRSSSFFPLFSSQSEGMACIETLFNSTDVNSTSFRPTVSQLMYNYKGEPIYWDHYSKHCHCDNDSYFEQISLCERRRLTRAAPATVPARS